MAGYKGSNINPRKFEAGQDHSDFAATCDLYVHSNRIYCLPCI